MTAFEIYWSALVLAVLLGVALIYLDVKYNLDSIGFVGIVLLAGSIISLWIGKYEGPKESSVHITPDRIIRTAKSVTAVYDTAPWESTFDMNIFILPDSLICVDEIMRTNMYGTKFKDFELARCN